MTKEEFEKGWCERSGITLEEYHADGVTLIYDDLKKAFDELMSDETLMR